jgi:GT2 family glycosyltransferase
LFIDADVTVSKDIIERVSDFFISYPNAAAMIGSYDDNPFEKDHLSQYRNLLHHFTHQCANTEASTFWGACGAIRRDVFITSGGFNETYTLPCIEDIELGYRLKDRGLCLHLLKDLQVKHLKKWEFTSMLKTDIFNRAIPWTELLIKRKKKEYDLNLSLSSRISTLLLFLLPVFIFAWIFSGESYFLSVLIILLLAINWNFYFFLLKKRGGLFLLRSLPFHWLYFLYSGLSYAYAFFKFTFNKLRLVLHRHQMSP